MKKTLGRKVFCVVNILVLTLAALTCIIPFWNLLAVSFSSPFAVNSGMVSFWPVDFTLKSYEFVLSSGAFLQAFCNTIRRVLLGVSVNMLLIIRAAYVLSKEERDFPLRKGYAWFFVVTILISAGMVPWYLIVRGTKLMNTIWALVLPDAVPVFSMLVLMNYMRGLPHELEDAAFIDGAGYLQTLLRIILPLCAPSIATVALFAIVGHWNAWFDGLLFMNRTENYPLQSYLQTIIISPEAFISSMRGSGNARVKELVNFVSVRSSRASQLFIATLPIMVIYPFLQRYFAKGLVVGSVKG